MRPHRGVTILVLGILGLVLCPFCGVAAWMMGNGDLEEMAAGRMDNNGRDLTNAGRICGIFGTVILLLQMVLLVVIGLSMVASSI